MSLPFITESLASSSTDRLRGKFLVQRAAIFYAIGSCSEAYTDLASCRFLVGMHQDDLESLADLLLKLGKYKDVSRVAENLVSSSRKEFFLKQLFESYEYLAMAQRHLKNSFYPSALIEAEKGLCISPQSSEFIMLKTECLIYTGKSEGRSWLIRIVPSLLDAELRWRYEHLKSIVGSSDQGLLSRIHGFNLMINMRDKAKSARENGNYTHSEYFSRTAIALALGNTQFVIELREERVRLMLEHNKLEESVEEMKMLQRLNPEQFMYWEKSGDVLMKLLMFSAAVDEYRTAYRKSGASRILEKLEAAETAARPTFYQILGVSASANIREIRSRYKQLAKSLHPDRNPYASCAERHEKETMMKMTNVAFDCLSDNQSRARYDATLQTNFKF